jgi:hypothetical protein
MLPPEPDELTVLIYSCEARSASEEMEKRKAGQTTVERVRAGYLMKRDSRSWSRPTNDFTVR